MHESRADFARRMKVSRAAVTQWANAGRLVLSDDGLVDVAASESRLAATLNSRGNRKIGGAPAVQVPESGELEFEAGTLTEARIRQARVKSRLDQLELDERMGVLVEKSRYDTAIADGLAPILSAFDTLPTRVAPKLVGLTDVRRIQDVIDDEIGRIRQDTADTLRAIAGSVVTRQ